MPPTSGNGLQDELEFLLAEIGALANRLRISNRSVHAGDKLPVGGKSILQILAQAGPQTVPQIARARLSSRQNIQILVNRLEQDGWVEFAANPEHIRSDLIRLTEHGRELLVAATEREATFLAGLLKHTTEEEVLSTGKLISRLRALLEGRAPTESKVNLSNPRKKRTRRSKAVASRKIEPALDPPALPDNELPVNLL